MSRTIPLLQYRVFGSRVDSARPLHVTPSAGVVNDDYELLMRDPKTVKLIEEWRQPHPLLGIPAAAQYLHVSPAWMRMQVENGRGPCGKRDLFTREQLDWWVESNRKEQVR